MKFFSINKFIENLKLLLDYDFESVSVVMSGEDMYTDGYNKTQGTPCLVKVIDNKKKATLYKYKEMKELFEDDYILSVTLPRKFNKEYLAVTIDVMNPQKSDKFEDEFYPRTFSKLTEKVLKQAKEQQKIINETLGISDSLFDI